MCPSFACLVVHLSRCVCDRRFGSVQRQLSGSFFSGDGMLAAHSVFNLVQAKAPYEEDDNPPAENPPAAEDTNPPKSAAPVPPTAEAEEAQEAEEAEEAT